MVKFDFIKKLREFKLYRYFRKLRFFLNRIPSIKKVKSFIKHYFGGLYNRTDDHHIFLLGGGLAFSLFVCIIPFVLIIFAVLGAILDSAQVQYQINTLIDTIIPYGEYSDYAKEIIFSRINEVVQYRTLAGIIGGFGLLFAASGLFSTMRTILNKVFAVETNVNVFVGKLRDFALVIMVLLIFFATTISMPILNFLFQLADSIEYLSFFKTGFMGHILFSLFSLFLIFVLFSILYYSVPLKKPGRKVTFISALWAAILWEAAKQLFGYYLYNYAVWGRIYGTYALIVVVAFWIYYSSVVFIIGAEIGRLFYERNFLAGDIVEDN
jgi:membrane protein